MPVTNVAVRCLAAVLAAAVAGAPAASAAAGGIAAGAARSVAGEDDGGGLHWAVQPASEDGPDGRDWYRYDLAPGDEVVDRVAVTNLGEHTVDFRVYATDAYTADDGGFALLPGDQAPTDLGSWVSLEAATYRVPAGHRLDVPFRLTVPENASPGDHAGGIVAAITAHQSRADGQQLALDQRVGARIYVRVDGPARPEVAVESVAVDHTNPFLPWHAHTMTVTYTLRNTGNLRVTGSGEVTVDGPLRWRLASTRDGDLPELLPGSSLTVTETIHGVAPASRLVTTVEVAASSAQGPLPANTERAVVWVLPPLLLAVLGAAAALTAIQLVRRRIWRRRGDADA